MMQRLLLPALVVSAPALGQAASERVFAGPSHYCGQTFAVDLAAGDKIEMREGPDFVLESLVSPRGRFGLYEGSAPQDGIGDRQVEAGLGRPTYLLDKGDGAFGYVIWTGTKASPFYIHVWGQAFRGDARDYALLRRLQLGEAGRRGCPKASFYR